MRRKCKLVLRGIPVGVTLAQLQAAFEPCRAGIAYVDFHAGKTRPLADACRLGTCWVGFGGTQAQAQANAQAQAQANAQAQAQAASQSPAAAATAPSTSEDRIREFIALAESLRFPDGDKEVSLQVEWAPQRKVPRKKRVKDSRIGTIESNPEYAAFLKELNATPEEKAAAAAAAAASTTTASASTASATSAGIASSPFTPISTLVPRSIPIIDFLRAAEVKARDAKLREKERDRLTARQKAKAAAGGAGAAAAAASLAKSARAAASSAGGVKSKALLRSEEKKKLLEKKKAKEKSDEGEERMHARHIDW